MYKYSARNSTTLLSLAHKQPLLIIAVRSVMSTSEEESSHGAPLEERIEGYKSEVLIPEIEQMMFVAGETGEPISETTTLIEQIVHEQVLELVGALRSYSRTSH